jgi:hypothetical protein
VDRDQDVGVNVSVAVVVPRTATRELTGQDSCALNTVVARSSSLFFVLCFYLPSFFPPFILFPSLRSGRPRGRSSSPGRVKNFLFSTSSRPALRSTQPPLRRVPGALFPGVKRPGREVDHSPPTSAQVKMWIYTSTAHTPSWRSA